MIMKVSKVTKAILAFVIVLIGFYLIFAFIAWDIKWVENGDGFFRFMFSGISLPISIKIAGAVYEDKKIK